MNSLFRNPNPEESPPEDEQSQDNHDSNQYKKQ
jgi:hypothetical protein